MACKLQESGRGGQLHARRRTPLHVAASEISQHVRHLETFFNTKLFRQMGHRLQLTEAGTRVYELASKTENEVEFTRQSLNELRASADAAVTITSGPGEPHSIHALGVDEVLV